MRSPLIIDGRRLLLCKEYLGAEVAEVWIGPHEVGPVDDDDARVLRDREEGTRAWKEGRTNRPSGISAFTMQDADGDGYYELDTAGWAPGFYRFNWHGPAGVETPHGSSLDPSKRDLEYSWAKFPNESIASPEAEDFVYWDPNGRGYGFRIEVKIDGHLSPAGNWSEEASFNPVQREALRRHGFNPGSSHA